MYFSICFHYAVQTFTIGVEAVSWLAIQKMRRQLLNQHHLIMQLCACIAVGYIHSTHMHVSNAAKNNKQCTTLTTLFQKGNRCMNCTYPHLNDYVCKFIIIFNQSKKSNYFMQTQVCLDAMFVLHFHWEIYVRWPYEYNVKSKGET